MCKYLHFRPALSHFLSLSLFFSISLCALAHSSLCAGHQALSKKENKGGESLELESALALTPCTEEKYKQINEEFDLMIKTQKMSVSTVKRGEAKN